MALKPVASTPGLWQDPSWMPESPGLYAVVVGVSSYPHLGGGSDPASETFGLRQLEVSARTAAAVFDWLRSSYRHKDLPVVWCYLLLSPTATEKPFLDSRNVTHYENPTDCQLRRAVQLWCSSLPTRAAAAQKSRTLFFFSGHGLQSNWDPLLLPSDYLYPPRLSPVLENCVSAREMTDWMKTHPVAEHLVILDACRNEFSPLAAKGSTANRVFPVNAPGPSPKAVASLAATAPNSISYQSSTDQFSFFGGALIEGLSGAGSMTTPGMAGPLDVEFMNLVKYVKPRVMQLLKSRNTTLEQTARPSLEPCDASVIVTQIPNWPPALTKAMTRDVSPGIEPPLALSMRKRPEASEKTQDSHFDISADVRMPVSALHDFSTAHMYFGHEYASDFLAKLQIYALTGGHTQEHYQASVRRVARDSASAIVRVDLRLPPAGGGVLAAFGGTARGIQALPLPTDENGEVPIRLTLAFDHTGLLRVEGQLGPSEDPNYDYLWRLFRIARLGSFIDAAAKADPAKLRSAVADKTNATTAAIAGATLLACGGKIRRIKDWTRNLMDWFPGVPDGAVLWAESLRASMATGEKKPFGKSDPIGEMAAALGSLEQRGVPFFVDVLELLDNQLRYLDAARHRLSDSQVSSLANVRRLTNLTFQVACPSGQFMSLSALPRPAALGKSDEPLRAAEMLDLLRPGNHQHSLEEGEWFQVLAPDDVANDPVKAPRA